MIAKVVVGLEIKKAFDYDAKGLVSLKKGTRVLVDFNNKVRIGFVVNILKKKTSHFRLKPILDVLDSHPAITSNLFRFSQDIASRYLYSQGEILEMMLPNYLRKNHRLNFEIKESSLNPRKEAGKIIYLRENINQHQRFEHYKKMIYQTLRKKRKVIICLPHREDVLMMKKILDESIKDVQIGLLFGTQSSRTQYEEWLKIRVQLADISIGTRFVIFAPFVNVGLIIVDKENFYGYFQPEKPFYHLRDLALIRAKMEDAQLVLHSDFPSLEAYGLMRDKQAECTDLFRGTFPRVKIFNLKDYKFKGSAIFSSLAQEIVRRFLKANKKVIIFWNRKGFANILRCSICGKVLTCPECGNFLSFLKEKKVYICRRCQRQKKYVARCPQCKSGYIKNMQAGIEKIESVFKRLFPDKKIVTVSKEQRLIAADWDVLIATQKMLFLEQIPSAELVIASGLDYMCSLGDYTSSLKIFFLAERLKNLAKEEFILFTFNPDYYPFKAILKPWQWFYRKELRQRRSLKFPPHFHLAKIIMRQKNEDLLLKNISSLKAHLEKNIGQQKYVSIYGPVKDEPFKKAGKFHYFLLLKAKSLKVLRKVLDKAICKFRRSSAKISLILK